MPTKKRTPKAVVKTTQKLLYIAFEVFKGAGNSQRAVPVLSPVPEKDIVTVWTLYQHNDPQQPPTLPFQPVHRMNAFIEDWMHDWNVDHKGMFLYASRVMDRGVWILLEVRA